MVYQEPMDMEEEEEEEEDKSVKPASNFQTKTVKPSSPMGFKFEKKTPRRQSPTTAPQWQKVSSIHKHKHETSTLAYIYINHIGPKLAGFQHKKSDRVLAEFSWVQTCRGAQAAKASKGAPTVAVAPKLAPNKLARDNVERAKSPGQSLIKATQSRAPRAGRAKTVRARLTATPPPAPLQAMIVGGACRRGRAPRSRRTWCRSSEARPLSSAGVLVLPRSPGSRRAP